MGGSLWNSFRSWCLGILFLVLPALAQAQVSVVSSTISSNPLVAGQMQRMAVTLTSSSNLSGLIVDIRIGTGTNNKFARKEFTGVSIAAGGRVTLQYDYQSSTSMPVGSYRMEVGVWNSSWATLLYQYRNAFNVVTSSTSTTTTTTLVSTSPTSTTCNFPNWVQGQYYAAGSIVKYTDGKFYIAKYANPGYNPTISTYYWAPYSCSGTSTTPSTTTTTTTVPTAPTYSTGSAIPLPSRLVATYLPLWTGMRATQVPTSYNQIYLFHAVPVKDGSGRAVFEYGYVVNSADIATVRSRGQRVVLTFGGANHGFNFSNRTQSQNFVTSIIGIINSLGGQVDGLDFNNFEAHIGSSPTEMVWIAQQLKGRYGRNFSISAPPAPDGNWAPLDRQITKAMVDAGVMDYAGPQFYDHYTLVAPDSIERWIDDWVRHFNGDASKVVIGFGANYSQGSSLQQVQQTWTRLKAKYPNIRGAFGWSAETDRNAGWTFGTYLGNNK